MIVYRICKKEFAHDLTGEGARHYGGRWNFPGVPCIYASQFRSLCILEFAVHSALIRLPETLVIASLFLPDNAITKTEPSGLPRAWHSPKSSLVSQSFGTKWLKENKQLALQLPSIIVPEESNFIINPSHPRFGELKIEKVKPFKLDPRLFATI
jgi:RES domain-containing protein